MTRRSSFKSRVRARMEKTGERYAAARRQLIDRAATPAAEAAAPAEAAVPAEDPASPVRGLQLPDEAMRERTGRTAGEWFALLDAWGAAGRPHGEIARWLVERHGVDGWWAQSVTVAYEQARGLRQPGQVSDGTFSITASRTVGVPVERLYEALADPALRERWLPGAELRVRAATAPRSFRADWEDGTRVAAGFTAKGAARAQIALAHERLRDAAEAARMKAHWSDRLAALKRLLEG